MSDVNSDYICIYIHIGNMITYFWTFDQIIEYALKNKGNNGRILLVKSHQFDYFKTFSNAKKWRNICILNFDEHFYA